MKPRIDPEFQALIPPLSDDERAQLEENIVSHGCRDPLVTWNGVLLDGHNRLEICTRHGIPFETVGMNFESKAHARLWMRANQIGRRNLTPAWKIELALANKEDLLAIGKAKASAAGVLGNEVRWSASGLSPNDKGEPRHNTQAEVAKTAGVSTGQVGMAEQVRAKAPDLWEKAKAGEVGISTAYKQVRKEAKRQEREERKQTVPLDLGDQTWQLHLCGVAELHHAVEPDSVDWVITDPPYPREYLPVYDDLAAFAKHALKPGGSLLCMVGQSYLPDILERLSTHLTYHWTIAYLTPGGQATQLWDRKVNTFWKPVLWLTKGKHEGDWIGDVAKSNTNDNDKNHHHWGQSESGMSDLIDRFTYPGETICDPFLGGGTTAVVATRMNRRFIGADIDNEAILTTTQRLTGNA